FYLYRSRRKADLGEEGSEPRVASDVREQPVELQPGDAAVALDSGALQPLECEVGFAPERVHLGDLVGPRRGVFLDEIAQRRVPLLLSTQSVIRERQDAPASDRVRLTLHHLESFLGAALLKLHDPPYPMSSRKLGVELERLVASRLRRLEPAGTDA